MREVFTVTGRGPLLLAILGLAAAAPEGLPAHDVDRACRATQDESGYVSGCIAGEQQAYEALKSEWTTLSPGGRDVCVDTASDPKFDHFFYQVLEHCVSTHIQFEEDHERATANHFNPD